ncbi:nucleoside hydrolase [Lactarius akahatsu]|uniref:Nucleoside hydrolase n=1 Tax=Lactarius akahatsu TaxID=416441 RepID=A0AAD4LEZ6_9AGAM|nr:nucleoside hydrolase [Lactarius akahatsu]
MNYVWLDCDPGHDDATAILLAIHCPNIHLLGVSTVHGNATADNTKINASRCLYAFAAPESVKVYGGATRPLLRPARHDPEIHGPDGLGGVEGLPSVESGSVRERIESRPAIEAIASAIRQTWNGGAGAKVTLVASGPLTNIALFVSVYTDLFDAIERIVFMGGGIGVGNRSAVAEFNILCDPEAAQIVLDTPIPKAMIPLNVTHKAIVTDSLHANLINPTSTTHGAPSGLPSSRLRHTLSTLISFFRETYKSTFGFSDGPPLHDALTIAYVCRPDLFTRRRYRVDVELSGVHTAGQTVADVWEYLKGDDTWGRSGKNCEVATDLDIAAFFELFFDCVANCDEVSPLNRQRIN